MDQNFVDFMHFRGRGGGNLAKSYVGALPAGSAPTPIPLRRILDQSMYVQVNH